MTQRIVHCSYHKCLTVYYSRVLKNLFNKVLFNKYGYKHYNSRLDRFYEDSPNFKITSVNNHSLNPDCLGTDYLISRFIRDPRDLVISGYFYHKKGTEKWCNIINPKEEDWKVVNGNIPTDLKPGDSYSSYLQRVSLEEGLLAEIEFRKNHFQSMREWDLNNPKVLLVKYENIIGNELEIFKKLFSFYKLNLIEKKIGMYLTKHYSMNKQIGKTTHIRNPKSGQWDKYFTNNIQNHFEEYYGDILRMYNYG